MLRAAERAAAAHRPRRGRCAASGRARATLPLGTATTVAAPLWRQGQERRSSKGGELRNEAGPWFGSSGGSYAPLALHGLGADVEVVQLHAEPPVYLLLNFVPSGDCDALVAAADADTALPSVQYEEAVRLDVSRLAMLTPLALVAGCVPAAQTHAAHASGGLAEVAMAYSCGVAAFVAGAAMLTCAATAAVSHAQRIFTGSKWALGVPDGSEGTLARGSPAASTHHTVALAQEANVCFRERCAALCRLRPTEHTRLETTLLTRYRAGERQRVHEDARLAGDSDVQATAAFHAAGGQRLAQIVAYVREPERGGETVFHHAALGGLAVAPQRGAALVFFPAFANGEADRRMPHSGAPVGAGEKVIINTWLMECVPDS